MKSFLLAFLLWWGFIIPAIPGTSQNVLTDGGFTTTTSITPYYTGNVPLNTWCSWLNNGTNVTPSVDGGVCKYDIYAAGTQSWDVQLVQWGFPLNQGHLYQLTYDVKADWDRSFGIFLGEDGGSWTNLNAANYLQQATTGWTTKTIQFEAYQVFPLHKLSFEMGIQNSSMYFDNIILEDLGPAPFRHIEMIGSSVPPYDWSAGADMQTTDGINYTLSNYYVPTGEVKFRQDQDWAVNWGTNDFPTGTGVQGGPNIPVLQGTYNISFNRITGWYNFSCIECLHAVGIIGSSVPPYDWNIDLEMFTTDGINYTLHDCNLQQGELRFRQDNDWSINWGGNDFPTGIGSINYPNIQVPMGTYDISFNRETGAYNFILKIPLIGVLGSALNGWYDDVDMQTTDGITYTLNNYHFNDGEVKFRQDDSWSINWGNTNFPYGYGVPGGPNIPIPAGDYTVTFNRFTGEYYFAVQCPDPVITCPADIETNSDLGVCGAVVNFDMPVPTDNCGYPQVFQVEGLPSGYTYPVGTTRAMFWVINSNGKSGSCSFNITVLDAEKPVIANLQSDPSRILANNHKMQDVTVSYDVKDNCGIASVSLDVTSNEAVNGQGDGDSSPDWIITDDHHVQLRAERSAKGTGRIYTISVKATDIYGNETIENSTVFVPHDAAPYVNKPLVSSAGNELAYTITPNPSAQFFMLNLSGASAEPINIKVVDAQGRILKSMKGNSNQSIRFGYDLKPGIYMIEMIQGTRRSTTRVVKQ